MAGKLDCIVSGSCVVDLICRPVKLSAPLDHGKLYEVEPLLITAGGVTSNAGVAMARMGLKVGIFSYVGNDGWAPVLRNIYHQEGIADHLLLEHPTGATSTTVVAIDPTGERSFLHCVGAPKLLNAATVHQYLDQLAQSAWFLLGYYSLLPNLENDLPEVFAAMKQRGIRTGLESGGSGGAMQPLDRILPHLDLYVPSIEEAVHQTGESDPQRIIRRYRDCGCTGVLGVKLGKAGVVLSGKQDEYLEIGICTPPGPVIDTTGAGDNFLGGLITGLTKGLPLAQAGKLGCATSACAITTIGGATGARDYPFTANLAGVV